MDNSIVAEPAVAQAPVEAVVASQPTEKMLGQAQVNEIVKNAKFEAVESYKRRQAQEQQPYTEVTTPRSGISDEDIKRVAGDEIKQHFGKLQKEAEERSNAEAAQRLVSMFKDKVSAGRDKYADFDNVTGSVALQHYPNVVHLLAEHVDNVPDVLYHLAQNRTKLHLLESACAHNAPDAIYEVKKLAESIKANNESSQVRNANTPLSQTRPSAGMDSGVLTMADLKKRYKG